MDVSIIIVNYNTKSLTLQCIDSVYRKTDGISYEIIVVDNASSDGSIETIENFYPKVIIIASEINLGFGKANNLAAQKAIGKYLFFLNPDTILLNNAIYILSKYLDSYPTVGICGGNLYDGNLLPAHSYSMFFPSIVQELNNSLFHVFSKILYGRNREFNTTGYPIEVAYITGADLMIRCDIFKMLEGFDSDFFMYYEETELSHRVITAHYKIISLPEAKIIHLEGKSFDFSENREKRILHGRFTYFYKKYSQTYNRIANVINLFFLKFASLIYKILGDLPCADKYKKRLCLYKEFINKWR